MPWQGTHNAQVHARHSGKDIIGACRRWIVRLINIAWGGSLCGVLIDLRLGFLGRRIRSGSYVKHTMAAFLWLIKMEGGSHSVWGKQVFDTHVRLIISQNSLWKNLLVARKSTWSEINYLSFIRVF